ncbi:ATP-binding cassette domain-containing protein [Quadrisphaera oryzae]|uniref:ATP-binding cassette domain-containing protein n=1 Tax=Quadrisphaera TaxID=317661 RepID=UPI00164827B9|nr:ATP-binding cassette domain-containing protein [Quadrisphaera sp. RL12-1S]MBC3760628.1 ATP-binding cassette domain-containing protein [Quadrisphaera sp. RL12-1S]
MASRPAAQEEASAPPLLEMRHIIKRYAGVTALKDVSLTVRRGDIHAICGENGAGKSTLMKVLSAVEPHGTFEGQIFLDGQECRFPDIKHSEQAGIAIIHQELAMIPELSVMENLFLGSERTRRGVIDWNEAYATAVRLLDQVGLREDPSTPIKNLGVGKQQLVEIAKALHKNAKLLILDEPTAALNESDSQHLLDLILQFRERGLTCIIISHKLNEIERVADAVTIIRDGQTIETIDVRVEGINEDRIIRAMVGRTLDHRFPEYTPSIGETYFEVKNWTVRHPEVPERLVCDDESFFVRRGEIVGFAGLVGAGRTELARSLFGRSYGQWVSGTITLDGREIAPKNVKQAIDAGMAYVSEDRKTLGLNLLDSIGETTISAALKKVSRGGVIDDSRSFVAAEGYRKELRTKSTSVLQGVRQLSGGNQQKVVLAKWLFTTPELLILDEPTRGIDVGAKYEIYGVIQKIAASGRGVILISSELPELLGLSDRIYTINEGRISGVLDRDEADQESLLRLMTLERKAVR